MAADHRQLWLTQTTALQPVDRDITAVCSPSWTPLRACDSLAAGSLEAADHSAIRSSARQIKFRLNTRRRPPRCQRLQHDSTKWPASIGRADFAVVYSEQPTPDGQPERCRGRQRAYSGVGSETCAPKPGRGSHRQPTTAAATNRHVAGCEVRPAQALSEPAHGSWK